MRATLTTLGLGAAFAYTVACGGGADRLCNDDSDCLNYVTESGYSVCMTEVERCVEVQCLANEHCDIGNYCNENNNCVPGCSSELDCRAGDACDLDTRACVPYGCRSTELDCGNFEECNTATGECELISTEHCSTCSGFCPGGGECFTFGSTIFDPQFCLFPCDSNADCPRGLFSCYDPTDPTSSSGDKYCVADCQQLNDDGSLPW